MNRSDRRSAHFLARGAFGCAARDSGNVRPLIELPSPGARKEIVVAKTLIDVDEEQLAAARKVLKTATKKDTVNAALRQVTALAARRRDLQRLTSGGLSDLADEEVMRAAWQR